MRVLGIDFSSAPTGRKPIQCAVGSLGKSTLAIETIKEITTLDGFATLLRDSYDVAAVDFPLGQPRQLIRALSWPDDWAGYVTHVSKMSREEFAATLLEYSATQPTGQKHLFRVTDRLANACSPMMVYGVPVAKMFHAGAPLVLQSGATVMPCLRGRSSKTIVEGYPALVARRIIGRDSYKRTKVEFRDTSRANRKRLLKGLTSPPVTDDFGIKVDVSNDLRDEVIEDLHGDKIDSIFCALQAAWVGLDPAGNFRVPTDVDALEGWIVDPNLVASINL